MSLCIGNDKEEDIFKHSVSLTLEPYQSWQHPVMAGVRPSQIKTPPVISTPTLVIALTLALHVFLEESPFVISLPLDIPSLTPPCKTRIKLPTATIFITQSLLLRTPLTKSLLIVLLLPRGSDAGPLVSGRRRGTRININFHQAPADPNPAPADPAPAPDPLLPLRALPSPPLLNQQLLLTRMALAHMSKLEPKKEKKKGRGSFKGGKGSSLESSIDQESESNQSSESKSESKSGNDSDEEAESESDSDWHERSESTNKYESKSKSDSEQKYESLGESDSDEENVSGHSSESESESVSYEASKWESEYEYDSRQDPFGSDDWSIVSTEAGKLERSHMRAGHVSYSASESDEEDKSDGSFESVEMTGESVDEDYVEASFEPSRVSIRSKNCNFRIVVVCVKMSSINCSAVYCKQ